MKLYADYIKERENVELVQDEHGFATYKILEDNSYYIVDIFVEKDHRKGKIASQLADLIVTIAQANGASKLIGSICLNVEGVTESMKVLLAYGFKFSHANGTMLYFTKHIGVDHG